MRELLAMMEIFYIFIPVMVTLLYCSKLTEMCNCKEWLSMYMNYTSIIWHKKTETRNLCMSSYHTGIGANINVGFQGSEIDSCELKPRPWLEFLVYPKTLCHHQARSPKFIAVPKTFLPEPDYKASSVRSLNPPQPSRSGSENLID